MRQLNIHQSPDAYQVPNITRDVNHTNIDLTGAKANVQLVDLVEKFKKVNKDSTWSVEGIISEITHREIGHVLLRKMPVLGKIRPVDLPSPSRQHQD